MNIGIIGFGLMGQRRATDIKRMKDHKIVVICDTNLENLKKYQVFVCELEFLYFHKSLYFIMLY